MNKIEFRFFFFSFRVYKDQTTFEKIGFGFSVPNAIHFFSSQIVLTIDTPQTSH
jgi:hypothetical protein